MPLSPVDELQVLHAITALSEDSGPPLDRVLREWLEVRKRYVRDDVRALPPRDCGQHAHFTTTRLSVMPRLLTPARIEQERVVARSGLKKVWGTGEPSRVALPLDGLLGGVFGPHNLL